MSFQIRNIREISNDPLTKFTNQLAKKLAIFLNNQENDKLENKEDIYSNGEDVDVVLRIPSLNSSKYFGFDTEFYPPTEPDNDKLKLWIKGDNLGNTLNDISGFNNHGTLSGDPVLIDGTPFDYGIHTGGTKSIAIKFNRPTSLIENGERITVPDNTSLQVLGISTGISYFIRFRIFSLSTQGGDNRTLFVKYDDASNAVMVQVSTDGRILFYLKRAGTVYKSQTASSTITTNTVYEVWLTYTNSGNVQHVYVNNVDKSLTSPADPIFPTDTDLFVMNQDPGEHGAVYGDFYDFELLKEKVVSSTEVGRHYTNKWTLANIPFAQVLIANYWATYYESASSTSFTSTSFSSTSFTI